MTPDPAQIWEAFDAAGFLTGATYEPHSNVTMNARVNFKTPLQRIEGDPGVIYTDYWIEYLTDRFPIKHGDRITVEGVAYKVRDIEGGALGFTHASLTKL